MDPKDLPPPRLKRVSWDSIMETRYPIEGPPASSRSVPTATSTPITPVHSESRPNSPLSSRFTSLTISPPHNLTGTIPKIPKPPKSPTPPRKPTTSSWADESPDLYVTKESPKVAPKNTFRRTTTSTPGALLRGELTLPKEAGPPTQRDPTSSVGYVPLQGADVIPRGDTKKGEQGKADVRLDQERRRAEAEERRRREKGRELEKRGERYRSAHPEFRPKTLPALAATIVPVASLGASCTSGASRLATTPVASMGKTAPHPIPKLMDLRVHRPDPQALERERLARAEREAGTAPGPSDTCWNCGSAGHRYSHCPMPRTRHFCYRCGRVGLDVGSCPYCVRSTAPTSVATAQPTAPPGRPATTRTSSVTVAATPPTAKRTPVPRAPQIVTAAATTTPRATEPPAPASTAAPPVMLLMPGAVVYYNVRPPP